MFKLIIKNLWARRRRNIVLLVELIIITIVAWAALDTVIVNLYVSNMPLGYEKDRLVLINFTKDNSIPAPDDLVKSRDDALKRFASMLLQLPEVEAVSRTDRSMLESSSFSCTTAAIDTARSGCVFMSNLYPGWNQFDVLGMKSVGQSPSTEELASRTYTSNEVVITESVARLFFGDENPIGHFIGENGADFNEENAQKVVGVVTDVRIRSDESDAMMVLRLNPYIQYEYSPCLMVRLKDGVSAQGFINSHSDMISDFAGSDIFSYEANTMSDVSMEYLRCNGYTNSMRLRMALAFFFLISLCLGVIGTFMLQTRKRSQDAGIMLSFGATPAYIRRMLLGEGFVLVTVAWAIGCAIYSYIARTVGLARGLGNINVGDRIDVPWIASFNEHFVIVSLIVYLLILVAVLAGICIPAWRISRVNPVDALRDE
ncbi:MAG: FtsX-like permease family protein [Muribaculum sp.]|nr:FtsX-like permease family protein [Muribaculum sp.]